MTSRFSILTPVHDPPAAALTACVASVLAQDEPSWEWCVVDDASTQPYVRTILARAAASDPRIRLSFRDENGGIVAASQDALALASGEFVALLDHDDLLRSDALRIVDASLRAAPETDYVYTDEDKVTEEGQHFDEFRKPDWSPERLRGQNYCCHLSVLRRSLVEEVGGFRAGFDGSQDYDLILRVTERARRIEHVREVLYHWRSVPGSAAAASDAKPYAYLAAERALRDHLARCGVAGDVEPGYPGYHRIRRRMTAPPFVSIIIPTNGASRIVWGIDTCLVVNAVASVVERSTYPRFEIVVMADDITPPAVVASLQRLGSDHVRVVPYDKPFNFADKINLGAVHARGEVLLALNDDVEVISPDWLETMVGHLEDPDVGMVGAKLLLANGRVQSAGHSHDPTPHHVGGGFARYDGGPFGAFGVARECAGVTAACAALPRAVFEEVGGMCVQFPSSFNDVDLSMKLLERGYRTIWTPFAELYHFESLTRDPQVRHEDMDLLSRRWGRHFGADPYPVGL